MTVLKKFVVFTLVFGLAILATACGSGNAASDGQTPDVNQTQEQSVSAESEVVEQTLPVAETNVSADEMIGNWKGVEDASQFVIITKTDTGYQYEDNDGKYPATYEKGILKVKATDTDTADVYIDHENGHLVTSYQGGLIEYEKK